MSARRGREQPQQPIVWSRRPQDGPGGIIRFQANAIVRDLLDFAQERGFGLNQIAHRGYSRQDQEQLAQLIGYSVSGFGDLPYARPRIVAAADTEAARMNTRRSRKKSRSPRGTTPPSQRACQCPPGSCAIEASCELDADVRCAYPPTPPSGERR